MQSIEFGVAIIAFVGALLGGLVTKYVIRALEIKERERDGDFLALIYLREAAEHVASGEKHGLSVIFGTEWTNRQKRIVNGIIQAAARGQKKYRETLYIAAMKISQTSLTESSFLLPSIEILTLIEEIETSYFKHPI